MLQERSIRAVTSPLTAIVLGTVLISLYLSPVLWSGWTGPDVYRAQFTALPAWLHTDWLDAVRRASEAEGNTSPLWFVRALPTMFWFAGPSLLVSKIVGFALIVANAATFLALVTLMTRSSRVIALCVVGFIISLEIRRTNDAILGGAISTPWSVELLFLAAMTAVPAIGGTSVAWFVTCIVATLVAILADPTNTVIVLLFIAFAYTAKAGDQRRLLRAGVLVATALAMRLTIAIVSKSLGSVGLDLRRLANQVSSPIPTLYRASGHVVSTTVSAALHDDRFDYISKIDAAGWLVAIAVGAATFFAILGCRRRIERFDTLLWTGAALWFGSILFGRPTPYLASFGFGLVFAYALRSLGSIVNGMDRSILAACGAFAAFWITYGNDRIMHDSVEITRVEDRVRQLFADALRAGALTGVRDGETVAIDARSYPFSFTGGTEDAGVLIFRYGQRRVRAIEADEPEPYDEALVFVRKDSNEMLVAGRGESDGKLADATIFRRYPNAALRGAITATVALRADGLKRSFRFVGSRLSLEHVVRRCGPVRVDDLDVPDSVRIRYGVGFFSPDGPIHRPFVGAMELPGVGSEQQPWRFGSAHATLDVIRGQCARSDVQLTFGLQTTAPATVAASVNGKFYFWDASEARRSISVPLDLSGSAPIPILFKTSAPAATDEAFLPRSNALKQDVYHMLVIDPQAVSTVEE